MSTKKQRKQASKGKAPKIEDLEITPLPKPIEVKMEEPNDSKYWIRTGMAVQHIDYPEVKMRVLDVKKFTKELNDGSGNKRQVTFVRGVICTWLDKDSKFQKGLFHTRELKEWK